MLDIKEQIALEQLVGNLARHRKWRYESVSKCICILINIWKNRAVELFM